VDSWLQAVLPPDARQRLGELRVRVVIKPKSPQGSFQAQVIVARATDARSASEPRVVEGTSCSEVARSAIVVVSVAASDALNASPRVAEPAPKPPAVAVEEVHPRAEPEPVAIVQVPRAIPGNDRGFALERHPRAHWLGVAVGAEGGFAGRLGVRADAFAAWALSDAFALGVRIHSVPTTLVGSPESVARLHLAAAGAQLCWLPELAPALRLGACSRVEGGAAWAVGSGARDPKDWGGIAAWGLSPTLSAGRALRVQMQGDFQLCLVRPRFQDDAGLTLATLPLFSGALLLGMAVAVP
jgi:hypothetical protein